MVATAVQQSSSMQHKMEVATKNNEPELGVVARVLAVVVVWCNTHSTSLWQTAAQKMTAIRAK